MKSVIALLLLLLTSFNCLGATLSLGQYYTYHLFPNKDYNHIGDKHTTLNNTLMLSYNDYSLVYFKDSINSDAYGLVKHYSLKDGRIQYGLGVGFYLIDVKAWGIWNRFWIDVEDRGIVPLFGPEMNIEVFKYNQYNIKYHIFANAVGYISNSFILTVDF